MNFRKASVLGIGILMLAGHVVAASVPAGKLPIGAMKPTPQPGAKKTASSTSKAAKVSAKPALSSKTARSTVSRTKASLAKSASSESFAMLTTSAAKNPVKAPALALSPSKSKYPALDFLRMGVTGNEVRILKSGVSQQATNIDLAIGKAEVMYLSRPVSRVSVSNPDVANAVIISPTQIQLIGKSVGVANVLLWGSLASAEHTVVDINVHRDVSVLAKQLQYVDPGIHIIPMAADDTVILTGEAETRESAQLAIEMAKAFFGRGGSSGAGTSTTSSAGGAGGSSGSGGGLSGSGGLSAGSGVGASGGGVSPNSRAPGSSLPGSSTNVINLIKVKGEPSTKIELVRQKMREIDPNIRIDVVPGLGGMEKVILSGRVPSASVASRALNLASVFYGKPGLKMVTGQGGNDFARLEVNSDSSSTGTDTTATLKSGENAGGANVLHGSVITDSSGNVVSMLEIAQKPQIRCNIKFLELNKIALNALGSSFSGVSGKTKASSWSGVQGSAPNRPVSSLSSQNPGGADWGTTMSRTGSRWSPTSQTFGGNWNEVFQNGVTQVFSINNQLIAAIQALEEKRQVRTLAEPTLTMLSGEQGSFLAGGEVPVAFLGGNGQIQIEFKAYGIRLNLLPNMTDDGKIQMQVAPEVSAVDPSISVQGVPGFLTRKMNTSLLVEPGQSFILAGLFRQEDTDSVSRLPGIGSLPIIGPFFKNQWKTKNHSEMVVLVKPEVIYSQTGSTATGNPPDVN